MIGTVLGNRYEIEAKVGVGGMAIVYKAMDKLLNRYVAVKLLRSEFQENEEFIRRFNIESQAAASLSHTNIVSIYDVGQTGSLQYIVMEFIEGITLKDYIEEKKGNIYWKEATDIAMQICLALEHAHSKHIIHRDIKPQNIMINSDGVIKVMDFGIARAASGGTTTMEAMGSAHYLSPEQARGGYTDNRSDIYSFGVVLYELFTGKLPFDGETPVAVAMQHMQSEAVKPRVINPEIPKSIENIILKAMSKEQRLRYESATAMLADIRKAYTDPEAAVKGDEEIDKFETRKIPPIVSISMPSDQGKSVVRRGEDEVAKKKKKRNSAVIITAIVICFVVAGSMGIFAAKYLPKIFSGEEKEEVFEIPSIENINEKAADDLLKTLRRKGFTITKEYAHSAVVKEGFVISQEPKGGEIKEGTPIVITISQGPMTYTLESYERMSEDEARRALTDLGLIVKVSQQPSNEYDEGMVIRHIPGVGAEVKEGDVLTLFICSGADEFEIINYRGYELEEAKNILEEFDVEIVVEEVNDDNLPVGVIVSQSPEASRKVDVGGTVTFYVSKGPAEKKVPDMLGWDVADAKAAISNLNLTLAEVKEIESGQPKGVVVRQSIAANTVVVPGDAITIWISAGTTTIGSSDTGL